MTNNVLDLTCGAVRGTWDLGRVSRYGLAAMQFPTGYNILVWLYTPQLFIQFSADYTILVWHHYNSRPAIQRWTCHTMLDRPCTTLPAIQLYTGEPVSREPVSPEPMHPSACVQRVNAWNNCVTHLIPPTGHMKLHTNYIYQASKLHTNYIYRPGMYM